MSSMRTGAVHFGTPEFALLADATARLAHHAGLPVRAGAAGDRRARAGRAGGARVGRRASRPVLPPAPTSCSRLPGSLSSFNVLSLEKLVMDDEAITMVRVLAGAGPPPTPDALAGEVIDAVGPAGDYLGQAHTRRHVRDLDRPTFLVREAGERWRARGDADIRAAAAQ